jgi:hypothetical protein
LRDLVRPMRMEIKNYKKASTDSHEKVTPIVVHKLFLSLYHFDFIESA